MTHREKLACRSLGLDLGVQEHLFGLGIGIRVRLSLGGGKGASVLRILTLTVYD